MTKNALFLLTSIIIFASCEKQTDFSVNQADIIFPELGGKQHVSLTANKPWTVKTDQSWCMVSPSAGDEISFGSVTVTCLPNNSYEERTCHLLFSCAEVSQTVKVSQQMNKEISIESRSYAISDEAQQIIVNFNTNVEYVVEIDEGCQAWIQFNSTKALLTKELVLDVAANEGYDSRMGSVVIKEKDGALSAAITIKQAQKDVLFLSENVYDVSADSQTLEIEVKSNIAFDIQTDSDWISVVDTKAFGTSKIVLAIEENKSFSSREGKVVVRQSNGTIEESVVIRQKAAVPIDVESLNIKFTNTSGTYGPSIYIGKPYTLTAEPTPANATVEYSWEVSSNIGRIVGEGASVTLEALEFGDATVILTDKRTNKRATFAFSTCVTDFEFTEYTGEINSQFNYPQLTLSVGETHQIRCSYKPNYATRIFKKREALKFKELRNINGSNVYVVVDSTSIIGINENGLITAKQPGFLVIQAANNGGVYKSGRNDGICVRVVTAYEEQEYNNDFNYANTIKPGTKMRFRLANASDVDVFKFTIPAQNFYLKFTYEGDAGTGNGVDKLISYTLYNSGLTEFGKGNLNFKSEGSSYSQSRWLNTSQGYIRVSVHDHAKNYPQMIPTGYIVLEVTTED